MAEKKQKVRESGAGTYICQGCGESKEPTRLNSNLCRTCDKGAPGSRRRRAKTYRLTLNLSEAQWADLTAQAEHAGESVYRHGLHLLVSALGTPEPEPQPEAEQAPLPPKPSEAPMRVPTADEWERMNKWMSATGRRPDPDLLITRKSGLLAWAIGEGFQP